MAVAGLMTPSMADPMSGNSKVKASISQEMSTSSGSRVRRLGTMAMSSNPYALRPDLPMPISTSATALPLFSGVLEAPGLRPGEEVSLPSRARPLRAGRGQPARDLRICLATAAFIWNAAVRPRSVT